MRTFQIPRETWFEELNRFTTMHEGWLASLDVFGPEIGAQREIANLPLIGVSADRVDYDGTIAISVARSAVEHLTHIIPGVAHIYVEQPDDGATAALLVESVDGTRTLLQLRAAESQNPEAPVVDPPVRERNTRRVTFEGIRDLAHVDLRCWLVGKVACAGIPPPLPALRYAARIGVSEALRAPMLLN